jgi:hypothetical protein
MAASNSKGRNEWWWYEPTESGEVGEEAALARDASVLRRNSNR